MSDDEPLAPSATAIVRDSLGVGIATGAYGVSFGAVAVAAGLWVAQTCALSLVMFTGASQFAFVGRAGRRRRHPLSGGLTALLLGIRNTLYGAAARAPAALARPAPRGRGAPGHRRVDRDVGDPASTPAGAAGLPRHGLSVFVLWNTATLLGALVGTALGDPRDLGLDAAVGAAFLALLWPQLRGTRTRVVGAASATLALALVPATPAGVPVLAAAGVALLAGLLPEPDGAR